MIHDTNYPGILTYATAGNGPQNVIEGNIIWNTNDSVIQSAADFVIRNNIVLGTAIALQAHQSGSPSNQQIVHNTLIDASIEVRNVSGSVVIANNAVYPQSGAAIRLISGNIGLVTVAGNVGTGGISGASGGFTTGGGINADFVAAHFNGAPPIDVFPSDSSALRGAGSTAHVTAEDFTARAGAASPTRAPTSTKTAATRAGCSRRGSKADRASCGRTRRRTSRLSDEHGVPNGRKFEPAFRRT